MGEIRKGAFAKVIIVKDCDMGKKRAPNKNEMNGLMGFP